MTNNKCCECRQGEHPDYDDNIAFCDVRETDGRLVLRGHLCGEHQQAFADDGCKITILKNQKSID
jgi:hypothetical protein